MFMKTIIIMSVINKIQLSGSTYDIEDSNATKAVELTQLEYDNLPSTAKTSNTLFIITDAHSVDISQYWTSAETQLAIDEAVSGKTDTSAFTAHTSDTTIHVTSADKTAWNAKSDFSGSYNDLSNKPTIPTVTSTITSGSTEAITSGAVYDAIGDIESLLAEI